MSNMIMKLKENENVCKFCNVIEALVLVSFPLAVPILIMWGASILQWVKKCPEMGGNTKKINFFSKKF